MASSSSSASQTVVSARRTRSITSINDVIRYLNEHATLGPHKNLAEVLGQWHIGSGGPSTRQLLFINEAMIEAMKRAMRTCLDMLEYRCATNIKAVRYVHAVLDELRVRAGK